MLSKKMIMFFLFQAIAFGIFAEEPSLYQKGWEAFTKNNRKEARDFFNKAIVDNVSKDDALLSLCFLDWNEYKLDVAFDDFCKFYENSSNTTPYLYAVCRLPFMISDDERMSPKKLKFFEKILTNPQLNGTLKAMLNSHVGGNYEKNNNLRKAKEYYAKMGAISHWQVLGTFDNTSGSGFTKDWGALTKPVTTDVFKNKVNADVTWYNPSFNKHNNWFYFDYYFYLNSAIMYAQTFITSPVDQEVYLRTGTSGSLKVWVNDALKTIVPEERNCDLDIYASKIKLNKGVNRILVQIGQSEIDQANFLMRITDENANPIIGLNDEAIFKEYVKSDDKSEPVLLPFFVETSLQDKVKDSPSNPLYALLLAETYLRNDKAYEATKILKELQVKYPKATVFSYRLAESYIRAKNKTDYDKEVESFKLNDPTSFFALQELYDDAMNSEKYTNATEISKKVKELYGVSDVTEDWDVRIASKEKRYNDVISMGVELYKKYPDNYNYMDINVAIAKNVSNNVVGAIDVLENYCRKYLSTKGMADLAEMYFDLGNIDKGFSILKKRIDLLPYASGYIDQLTDKLIEKHRFSEALATTDLSAKLSPFLPDIYKSRGLIYKNLNENDKAMENFKKAIYYEPTSYDSRSQLRLLEKKKDIYELFSKIDVDKLISTAPTEKEYPQDNSLLVLNDNQLVVYPEGAKEYRFEIAIKILNKSGIEAWKEYNVGYNRNNQKLIIDKSEIIKANGSKVKAETNNDNAVVFSNLEVNDVLHLEYRIQDVSTGKLANHFFDRFLFQFAMPSILNRYCILAPKNKDFKYVVANGNIEPKITTIDENVLYEWQSNNLPAVKFEPYRSSIYNIVPTLHFSSMPDWKYVSNWYHDLTFSKFNSDFVLKETVKNLLKGNEKASEMEKVKIFYNYILENITYSNVSFLHGNYIPQKASRTITTRLGDCKDVSTLFVAFCNEENINANLVLISTRDNGNNIMPLPTINFNHCIAQLNIDNKTYYLELTDNKLPFGAALSLDLKSNILQIPFKDNAIGDKLLSMDMPFRMKNDVKRIHNLTITGRDILDSRHGVYYQANASSMRDTYKNIGSEEQLKRMNQNVASDFTVPIKISDLNFTNLDNLKDSMICEYKVDVKNYIQVVAGMNIFTLPWIDKFNSLNTVAEESRKYPFEFWSFFSNDTNSEVINITIPSGKSFVEVPQNIHLECSNATYDLIFNTKNFGKLTVKRIFTRKSEQVSITEYPDFRDFMNKVNEADNKQFALK